MCPETRQPAFRSQPRPNVVFVFADEWRAQATGYAGDANCRTPALDALARESVNFVNAVSGCPVCCPYRASLVTGQYPLTHGVIINDVELDPTCNSVARAFSAGGYDTAYIGKWHLYGSPDGHQRRREARVPRDCQLGFDYWKGFECCHEYNNSPYYFNDDPTERKWAGYDAFAQSRDAADYIRAHARGEKPFMLMLSWGPPHFPLDSAPPEYQRFYEGREIVLRPNVPSELRLEAQDDLRGYYAHIAALDDALRIVLDAIRDSGIERDTVFVFTSDHGEMAKSQGLDTKLHPFDESILVPFLVRYPRVTNAVGRTIPVPIDAPDIMPTLLGIAGLPVPGSVEGIDWSPILRGEATPTGDEDALLTMPTPFHELRRNGIPAYRGVRTARYTYVRDINGPRWLFDNASDPYQMRNLIGRPEHRELQMRLESRLSARLAQRDDDFLADQVYLDRLGLAHYAEANAPLDQKWRYPWDEVARG